MTKPTLTPADERLLDLVQLAQGSEASERTLAGMRLLEERTRRVEIDLAFLNAIGCRLDDLDVKHVVSHWPGAGRYDIVSRNAVVVRVKGRPMSRHEIGIDGVDGCTARLCSVWLGGEYGP